MKCQKEYQRKQDRYTNKAIADSCRVVYFRIIPSKKSGGDAEKKIGKQECYSV